MKAIINFLIINISFVFFYFCLRKYPGTLYKGAICSILILVFLLLYIDSTRRDFIDLIISLPASDYNNINMLWRNIFTLGDFEVGDLGLSFRNSLSGVLLVLLIISMRNSNGIIFNSIIFVVVSYLILSLVSVSAIFVLLLLTLYLIFLNIYRLYIKVFIYVSALSFVFILFIYNIDMITNSDIYDYYNFRVVDTTLSRLEIYENSLEEISKSPIFGHGAGYRIPHNNTFVYPHNGLLGAWLSSGIFYLILVTIFFICILANMINLIINKKNRCIYYKKYAPFLYMICLIKIVTAGNFEITSDLGFIFGFAFAFALKEFNKHGKENISNARAAQPSYKQRTA